MLRVGIIGFGFMGGVHFRNWQLNENAQVAAVCDANPIDGTVKQGNIDAGSDALDFTDVSIYTDIGDMLENESLDAVSITLPTHLHKTISIQCLEAGVHVLCEKPMALSVEDCDAMIAAADKAGKQLMIGHCIRFWPVYDWLKKAVESGEFGPVMSADFSRLTYAPAWDADSWFADQSKSGGIGLDLHIHDLDFVQYLFGAPKGIHSSCACFENGVSGHVQTLLDYADNSVVSATASWMMPESFGFEMSFKLAFEKAAMVFNGAELKIYPAEGEPFVQEVEAGDGYRGEVDYFADLISEKNPQEVITPEQARESVRMALEATQA